MCATMSSWEERWATNVIIIMSNSVVKKGTNKTICLSNLRPGKWGRRDNLSHSESLGRFT